MQTLIVMLLFGAMGLTLVVFAVRGMRQQRRTVALARKVEQRGMRFSAEDPFNLIGRHGMFALMEGGHSGLANNVTHGLLGSVPVRAFDFQMECGHGTRRTIHRCLAVIVEFDRAIPELLMWRTETPQGSLLPAQFGGDQRGPWTYRGNRELAMALGETAAFRSEGGGLQCLGNAMIVWSQAVSWRDDYIRLFPLIEQVVRLLRQREPVPSDASPCQNIESAPST